MGTSTGHTYLHDQPTKDGAEQPWWQALEPLAAATRAGDSSAQTALLTTLRPIVAAAIARAVSRPLPVTIDRADVEQEAALQTCNLIRAFDPARGVSLPVFVRSALSWRLANYLRAEARRVATVPLAAVHLEEIADTAADLGAGGLANPRLQRAIGRLSPRQRAIIAGRYFRERTTRQLAEELGLTEQAITSTRRRAEAALRRDIGGSVPPDPD